MNDLGLYIAVALPTLGAIVAISVIALDSFFPAPELRAMRARHKRADKRRARAARALAQVKARLS